jgi:GTP-binding protein HflX
LLSDTVGFIRNLPHTLVTSFRATLEEVQRAEVLLHVSDAADPLLAEHQAEVEKVLGELDVLRTPRIEVLNKIDLLDGEAAEGMRASGGIGVSALRGEGMEALLAAIDGALTSDPLEEAELWVPQSEGEAIAAFEAGATVLERNFETREGRDGVKMRVAAPRSLLGRWREMRLG